MKMVKSARVLDQLVSQLGDCLTPESARRLLALKADAELQGRVEDLAGRHALGRLLPRSRLNTGITFPTAPSWPSSSRRAPAPGQYRG